MASLYTAYFDESGTHGGSEMAVVAGFVSNVTEWKRFSDEWQAILTARDLQYFHMTDFANLRGQFEGWTEPERRELLGQLLPVVTNHTFWSAGAVVPKERFETLVSEPIRRFIGGAYGLATLTCWRHLGLILNQIDGWIDCLMEAGAEGRHAVDQLYAADKQIPSWHHEHRVIGLSFHEKKEFPPLQAADLLAYEVYKQSRIQFGVEVREPRHPIKQLAQVKHQWVYVQDKHLTALEDDLTRQFLNLIGNIGDEIE